MFFMRDEAYDQLRSNLICFSISWGWSVSRWSVSGWSWCTANRWNGWLACNEQVLATANLWWWWWIWIIFCWTWVHISWCWLWCTVGCWIDNEKKKNNSIRLIIWNQESCFTAKILNSYSYSKRKKLTFMSWCIRGSCFIWGSWFWKEN